MKFYSKEHIYGKYKFNVKVTLDQYRRNGKSYHLVETNEENKMFISKEYVSSDFLVNTISETLKSAKNWVEIREGKDRNQDDVLLEALGFEK